VLLFLVYCPLADQTRVWLGTDHLVQLLLQGKGNTVRPWFWTVAVLCTLALTYMSEFCRPCVRGWLFATRSPEVPHKTIKLHFVMVRVLEQDITAQMFPGLSRVWLRAAYSLVTFVSQMVAFGANVLQCQTPKAGVVKTQSRRAQRTVAPRAVLVTEPKTASGPGQGPIIMNGQVRVQGGTQVKRFCLRCDSPHP
jgi:hypothetical protein